MSQSAICRLCFNACVDFKRLCQANELYELTLAYFHPKIVDMEAAKHLDAVCLECVRHINDFHDFQETIGTAQVNLLAEHTRGLAIKTELDDGMTEDLQCPVGFSDYLVSNEAEAGANAIKIEEEALLEDYQQPEGFEIISLDGIDAQAEQRARNVKMEQCNNDSNATNSLAEDTLDVPGHSEYGSDYADELLLSNNDMSASDDDTTSKTFRRDCKICGQTTTRKRDFVLHMSRHNWQTQQSKAECQTKPECQICHKVFSTKVGLAQHYSGTHCPPGLHPCNECGKMFNKRRYLQQHRRNVHVPRPKPHKCDTCGKAFRFATELKNHVLTHTLFNSYACAFCSMKFKHTRNLVLHTVRIHPHAEDSPENSEDETLGEGATNTGETHACRDCGRSFNAYWYYHQHRMKIHSSQARLHTCETCGRNFMTPSELERHRLTHTKKRIYLCLYCPMKFKYPIYLVQHMKRVHPHRDTVGEYVVSTDRTEDSAALASPTADATAEGGGPPPSHSCDECGKTFSEFRYLQQHLRVVHSPFPKLHTCDPCGRSFRTAGLLKRHVATHSETQSDDIIPVVLQQRKEDKSLIITPAPPIQDYEDYPCEVCGKTFTEYRHKRQHMRNVHSPQCHTCDICGRGFRTMPFLKRHLATHGQRVADDKEAGASTTAVAEEWILAEEIAGQPCQECGETFEDQVSLERHECRNSDRATTSSVRNAKSDAAVASPTADATAEGGGPAPSHSCDKCGKTFSEFRYLQQHIRVVHCPFLKLHKCDPCGRSFGTAGLLKRHVATHSRTQSDDVIPVVLQQRKEDTSLIITPAPPIQDYEDYPCEVCGKTFTEYRHKRQHMRNVHSPQCHTCDICGRGFRTVPFLKRHLATHGQRVADDKEAGASTTAAAEEWILAEEIAGQTCHECGETFEDQVSLERHECRNSDRATTSGVSNAKSDAARPKRSVKGAKKRKHKV